MSARAAGHPTAVLHRRMTSEGGQHATGTDPAEPGYYDRVLRTAGIQAAWHRSKFEHVRRAMGPHAAHLDIACGPGSFLGMLESGRAVGVDLSPAQLSYARRRYGAAPRVRHFVASRADALPFAASSFDVITCIELIEHVPEEAALAMLVQAHTLLGPGGRLLVTTPNYRSPWRLLEPLISILGPIDYRREHITRYERGRLHALLVRAGFTHVRVESFQAVAPFLAPLGARAVARVTALERSIAHRGAGCLLLGEARI
ncbi:MAG: class I SAM-dependent methyltransferase [Geminicoccaceae bacterium]|nr:class I SAM-dependent methyltransferase [Geminicoccaceae bacterium]